MEKEANKLPWGQKKLDTSKAKKVFSGVIFDVYQWEQKMFDGSYTTFEQLKRTDTVQVIAVTKDQKIIILEEEQPGSDRYLSLPGGRVDKGEKPEDAAKRELLEETGYEAKGLEKIIEKSPFAKIDWAIHFYLAKNVVKMQEQSHESGEKIKVHTVDFDEFVNLITEEKIYSPELEILFLKCKIDNKLISETRSKFGL